MRATCDLDVVIQDRLRDVAEQCERSNVAVAEGENGLDEQQIVRRSASHVAFAGRQEILDPLPLVVQESQRGGPEAGAPSIT